MADCDQLQVHENELKCDTLIIVWARVLVRISKLGVQNWQLNFSFLFFFGGGGVLFFKGGHNILRIQKFNDMVEIVILRNSIQNTIGVLKGDFWDFDCPHDTWMPLLAKNMVTANHFT